MTCYTIFYEYLDKRGYRRTKKVLCVGKERLREKCIEINNLDDKKPVATPIIYITTNVDSYSGMVNFEDVLGGNIDE